MMRRHTRGALVALLTLALCGALGCRAGEPSDATAEAAAPESEIAAEAPAPTPPRAPTTNPIDVEGSAALGPADAPVTLVEFSDFQ